MADPTTPNISLAIPLRGSDVNTWDTPVNNNMMIVDSIVGGTATLTLSNASVVLSPAQFQAGRIAFNGALSGNVNITFPSSFTKSYTIYNVASGSSAFTITLNTAGGGQVVCCPPGQSFDIWNDGANITYHNFGPPIGGYINYGGIALPNWITGCSIQPYLNCDGSTFSAVTFPNLFAVLGTNTLPDARGRVGAAINQGTGRINSSNCGLDGNTRFAVGGHEMAQAHAHAYTFNDPGHTHQYYRPDTAGFSWGGGGNFGPSFTSPTDPAVTGITFNIQPYGAGNAQNLPPTFMHGLTLIRAG